jgi:hypothetical protein
MNSKYEKITLPDSAIFAGDRHDASFGSPDVVSLDHADLAAEAAALEASQVSARLAAAALSLTNLRPDAIPRLLQRP